MCARRPGSALLVLALACVVHGATSVSIAAAASSSSSSMSSSSSSADAGTIISVTDDKERINAGGDLVYRITLRQNTVASKNVDVTLELPQQANIATPQNGGVLVGNLVRWRQVTLLQNVEKVLTVQLNIRSDTPDATQLVATLSADGKQASDVTVVGTGNAADASFTASISDNETEAVSGEALQYVIRVKNTGLTTQTKDVVATLSQQTSILDATPAATISHPMVTWKAVTFQPNQELTFTVNAEVRRRLTNFIQLQSSVRVDTVTATDSTTVNAAARASSSSSSARSQSSLSSAQTTNRSVLFRKVADVAEVLPGGTVRYTIFVQNVLLQNIDDAVITDRFDPSILTVGDAGGATILGPGQLQWTLPRLAPGEVWRRSYSFTVSPNVPNGTQISNIASIAGEDVAYATLEEKVGVARASVVSDLPSTGASYDLFALLASMPIAGGITWVQRRIKRV